MTLRLTGDEPISTVEWWELERVARASSGWIFSRVVLARGNDLDGDRHDASVRVLPRLPRRHKRGQMTGGRGNRSITKDFFFEIPPRQLQAETANRRRRLVSRAWGWLDAASCAGF